MMAQQLGRCLGTLHRQNSSTSLLRQCIWKTHQNRSMASMPTSQFFMMDFDDKSGVATFKMNKKPVNSYNMEFLTEMTIAIEKLEGDNAVKGLILTSNLPKIFSAGFDILEMYQPDEARLKQFWSIAQDFWIKLYGSRLVTIAAINGHSPAAGALAAMSCDYRIMAEGKYTMGMNETLLGIVAPFWFQSVLKNTVGHREAERALGLGHLYSPQEALIVGMVDKIVPEQQVYPEAMAEMEKWLKIPAAARHLSKLGMRQPALDALTSRKQEDIDSFVNFITQPTTQKTLGMYLESLKKKAEKRK